MGTVETNSRTIDYEVSGSTPILFDGRPPRVEIFDQYLEDIAKYPLLDLDQERMYAERAQNGDEEARKKLINSNLRFVVKIAKTFQNKGLPLQDLVQYGNEGLVRAVDKYDLDKGTKLISYAVWWIKQAIRSQLSNSNAIHIPLNAWAPGLYGRRLVKEGMSVKDAAAKVGMNPELLSGVITATEQLSLDTPIDNNDPNSGSILESLVNSSTNGTSVDEELMENARHDAIYEAMETLNERERKILILYFGLEEEEYTLEEIGSMFGVTRERIRQLKDKALERMRHRSRSRKLEDFHL